MGSGPSTKGPLKGCTDIIRIEILLGKNTRSHYGFEAWVGDKKNNTPSICLQLTIGLGLWRTYSKVTPKRRYRWWVCETMFFNVIRFCMNYSSFCGANHVMSACWAMNWFINRFLYISDLLVSESLRILSIQMWINFAKFGTRNEKNNLIKKSECFC